MNATTSLNGAARLERTQFLKDLRHAKPLINPSLLACDFAHLADEIAKAEDAGAKLLHLDVMDGHFVPNMSIGIPVVEAVRRCTDLPLDVHLMISDPGRYMHRFRDAGADLITIHIEAVRDPRPLLTDIRATGAAAGISLNPRTSADALRDCLDLCDLALVMSVEPGFGGQTFDPMAAGKIRRIRELGGPDLLISVDGGVCSNTIGVCASAGADVFVTGSALFSQHDYGRFIEEMTEQALAAKKV